MATKRTSTKSKPKPTKELGLPQFLAKRWRDDPKNIVGLLVLFIIVLAVWRLVAAIGIVALVLAAWTSKYPRETGHLVRGLAIVGALLVMWSFLTWVVSGQEDTEDRAQDAQPPARTEVSPDASETTVSLNADIYYGALALTITNTGNAPWKGCFLMLNPGFVSTGYTHRLQRVVVNNPREILLADFVKGDERFNPLEKAPSSLEVRCNTEDGKSGKGVYSLENGRGLPVD